VRNDRQIGRKVKLGLGDRRAEGAERTAHLRPVGEISGGVPAMLQPVGVAFWGAAAERHFIAELNRDF
jgi:hypothetical protein